KILANNAPLDETVIFNSNFSIYLADFFFPIFLFLSIIWFTSKLANNTEIIAVLSSGVSFTRFLRRHIIGDAIISLFALVMSFYLVPNASKGYNEFRYTYMHKHRETRESNNVYKQLNDTQYIHVNSFNPATKTGFECSLETFDKNNKLKEKIHASTIKWNEADSTYSLRTYSKRTIGE